ncbi:MAG: 3-isopropylmalate dehydratase large subunit [Candidatus Aegiribacteria sp.]|nr:3-isopropylmalate dehydratase large subunit [Candidatus Aegiribacteria sp.]MBD3295527.1 3-isopropylmalate dehydratase large subunit [Candidatus Fermentibacteria bacterium]
MGRTLIEKIMQRHGAGDCSAGDVVWMDIDNRTARDFAGASVVANLEKYGGQEPVADKSKTFFTFDCNVPANTIPYANNQQKIRYFARKHGLKVYDVDAGIGSHVVIEEKYGKPGTTTVGTDSHLNIMGSMGAFGQGMGDVDIAYAFKTGQVWFQVPETVKVALKGMPGPGTEAKDVALAMLSRFSNHELLGKAVEVYGEWADSASVGDCVTLSSLATEMGAIIALLPPNSNVLDYFGMDRSEAVYADEDADYSEEYELNIDGLEPLIAAPPSPTNVYNVGEITEVRVDTVFVGSCTNGTYQDLKYAAELLKGRKVAPGMMLKVVPATRKTWSRLLEEGYLKSIFDAGGIVSNAGCGGCASGQIGMTGEGEVQISTSNRNFRGKQGKGDTYLAGIGTAIASAVFGRIASVDELKEEV